jgi:PAS domain S-box-containing protein
MATIKILFLEHDLNDVELIKRQLSRDNLDFQIKVVTNRAEFEQELAQFQPDIVLADYQIPQYSGMDALIFCRCQYPNLPFIFVTGSISEEVAVESIKSGAWDYILKDNLLRLTPAINNALKLRQEIVERETTQKKLIASEELHRKIFDIATDIICILDSNGQIREINNRVKDILEYDPEEILGKNLFDLLNEVDRKKARQALEEVHQSGRVHNKEFTLTSKSGKETYFIVDAIRLDFSGVGYNPIVIIFHDITARRFLEMQVQKSEKQESLALLARGLAHDFNNILTVIIGNASLMQMVGGGDPRMAHYIENIMAAGHRAKEITDQMMRYAKGATLKIKPGSIASLLNESLRLVLAGSNIKPILDIAPDLWQAEMDEGQISQVINNLVMNAIQAMPNGGKITISAQNRVVKAGEPLLLKPGHYVCIAVKDEGIGISPEHLSKLFTPYFTTKEKGNGLGLANAYTIVKNHNGLITVESKVGVGSTFYVYLPASLAE